MANNTMMNMTNKDATECIKANICYKQSCCNDGICKSTDDRPCAIDVAIEALEAQDHKCENCDSMERLGNCVTWGIPVEPHMSCKLWEEKE